MKSREKSRSRARTEYCSRGRFPRGSRPSFTRSEHHVTLDESKVEILYFWTIFSRKSTKSTKFPPGTRLAAPRHARRIPGGNFALLVDFLEEIVRKYKVSNWFVTSVMWCSDRANFGRLPRENRPRVQDLHLVHV
uniref:Uncharacterized protein n=1 Tax=Trichogramma kaykai TaxID=54128 RepID=A0ABD2X9H0_9HYME